METRRQSKHSIVATSGRDANAVRSSTFSATQIVAGSGATRPNRTSNILVIVRSLPRTVFVDFVRRATGPSRWRSSTLAYRMSDCMPTRRVTRHVQCAHSYVSPGNEQKPSKYTCPVEPCAVQPWVWSSLLGCWLCGRCWQFAGSCQDLRVPDKLLPSSLGMGTPLWDWGPLCSTAHCGDTASLLRHMTSPERIARM
jgi:hypothetical protein